MNAVRGKQRVRGPQSSTPYLEMDFIKLCQRMFRICCSNIFFVERDFQRKGFVKFVYKLGFAPTISVERLFLRIPELAKPFQDDTATTTIWKWDFDYVEDVCTWNYESRIFYFSSLFRSDWALGCFTFRTEKLSFGIYL